MYNKKMKKTITLCVLAACFFFLMCAKKNPEEIIKIAAGTTHSMAIKSDNSLWVWGENTFGQLGNGKTTMYRGYSGSIAENNDINIPTRLLGNIIEIAAGDGFSIAVNSKNELLTWGKNDRGQLGDGTTMQSGIPKKIMDNVVYADACRNTALAIKKDKTLWIWGNDVRGLNIARDGNDLLSPVLLMKNVKKAVAGYSCIIILDNNNRVYGIGKASDLGINNSDPNRYIPVPVLIMNSIKDIASGGQQSFALDFNSALYGWGANGRHGSVGSGSSEWWVYSPELVSENVKKVFSRNMLVKNDNSLWVWGGISSTYSFRATVEGQGVDTGGTIIDTNMIVYGNKPVKIMDNALLACGNSFHCLAADKTGNLFSWGNNQFGELGNGKQSIFGMDLIDGIGEYEEYDYSFREDNSVLFPAIITNLYDTR